MSGVCGRSSPFVELQKHYSSVQALALGEDELQFDEKKDTTLPDEEGFGQDDVKVREYSGGGVLRVSLSPQTRLLTNMRGLRGRYEQEAIAAFKEVCGGDLIEKASLKRTVRRHSRLLLAVDSRDV